MWLNDADSAALSKQPLIFEFYNEDNMRELVEVRANSQEAIYNKAVELNLAERKLLSYARSLPTHSLTVRTSGSTASLRSQGLGGDEPGSRPYHTQCPGL